MTTNAMPAAQWRVDRAESVASDQRVADRIAALLASSGVKTIFGLPGGAIAPLEDALLDVDEINTVTVRHENHALFMAAGYARTSGHLGVATVTSGPGILNSMTGLASAYCDNIPVLLLAGEVPRRLHGKHALQDGEHLGIRQLLGPLTKWSAEVPDPGAATTMLARAMSIATSGRPGPVVLILPMDVLTAPVAAMDIAVAESTSVALADEPMNRVADTMLRSQRGVLFAGSGVRTGDGPQLLRTVAEYLQWPVMTTPKGKGVFPEDHPSSLGVFGMGGHPSARAYLEGGVDTLVAIGTGLGDLATNGWSPLLRPTRSLIHVDVDAGRIGRNYTPDIAIGAPAALFMADLCRRLPLHIAPDRTPRYGVERNQDAALIGNGPEGRISPARAIWEVQRSLPDNTIFTIDSGNHFFFATHYLETRHPDAFIAMVGLGSMGSSIAAIGAKLAQPGRCVAVVCGDGGFAMLATEVATAAQLGLAVIFFVFNDQRLGMVERGNARIFGRTPVYSTEPLDVSGMARSVGARAAMVERAGDILALDLAEMLDDGPVVIDVRIDRQVAIPDNERFQNLARLQRDNQCDNPGRATR